MDEVTKKRGPALPILIAVLVVLAAIVIFLLLRPTEQVEATPKLGYATEGITAVEDGDALQEAVGQMLDKASKGFALEYKGVAKSTDGTNFTCYIANSPKNEHPLYIDIYTDAALTDQLFLSGVIDPGQAFEQIELNRPLEEGTHTVYVVHTKVTEDLSTIYSQVVITMEFVVE